MTTRQTTAHLERLECRRLLASSVQLLGDLNPTPAGSDPAYFVPFGDQVVFNAETNDHQQGLWISDGNLKHTQLLGELNGYAGTVIGNVMYFEGVVDDPSPGVPSPTLWRTDGTASGTYQVADVPMTGLENLGNGRMVFNRTVWNQTDQLWSSDGTAAGTVEINALGTDDRGSSVAVFQNKLYYYDTLDGDKSQLWVSDGTAVGTHVQFDVNSAFGTSGQTLNELLVSGGKLFFSTAGPHGGRLYAGDGTAAGTVVAQEFTGENFYGAYNLTDANGTLLFEIPTSFNDWRSDGTPAGTMPFEYKPPQLAYFAGVLGSKWIFDNQSSLIATDGTTAGTVTLRTFNTTPHVRGDVAIVGNYMYLDEGTSDTGNELWRTDGTPAGTVLVADINPGPAGSNPLNITALGSRLVFAADTGPTGIEPVIYDPAASRGSAVKLLHDFPGTQDSDPQPILTISKTLYTMVEESQYHYSLFKTAGTTGGTTRILADVGGYAQAAINYGGLLYFIADGGFWRSDGTPQGTVRFAGGHYSNQYWEWLNIINGTLYYIIQDHYESTETAGTLFAVDTPLATPRAVTSIGQSSIVPMVRDGLIYFRAVLYNPLHYRWYVTDGTTTTPLPNGTTLNWPGPGPQPPADPAPAPPFSDSIMIKGTRYYAYDDGVHGTELWFDDGRHPPAMLADLYPGAASSLPDDLALVNGRLVFAATTPDAGRELYRFEPISRPSRTATGLIPELPMSDRSDAILSLIFGEPVQSAGAVGLF